jgi:predicted GNAT superfamily acetyltransferase
LLSGVSPVRLEPSQGFEPKEQSLPRLVSSRLDAANPPESARHPRTFDPLEIKNAYLNIEKLGAIARRYNVNQYGITTSPLQGGLPTDRLVAEWWLKSKRVQKLLKEGANPAFECQKTISVPAEIYNWKASPETRGRALEVQDRNRAEFLKAFANGLAALGYERDHQGNGKFLLGGWDENWSYS